jgi:hypothetical protein
MRSLATDAQQLRYICDRQGIREKVAAFLERPEEILLANCRQLSGRRKRLSGRSRDARAHDLDHRDGPLGAFSSRQLAVGLCRARWIWSCYPDL